MNGTPPERATIGTGKYYGIPDPQAVAARAQSTLIDYSARHEHLFVATVSFRVADPTAPAGLLDRENLFTPALVGCIICEQEWTAGLEHTRCPGDPTGNPWWDPR